MSKLIDLTGKIFGRLTVIKRVEDKKYNCVMWECLCECGNTVIVSGNNLKSNHTKSCGCLNKELSSKRSKRYNTYDLTGSYGIGYTANGDEFYFDLDDYDLIKNHCWHKDKQGYIRTRLEENKKISMHRLLYPESKEVDHANGKESRHDNRRYNLRVCTHQENMMNIGIRKNNTSGVNGVYWNKDRNKWFAVITYNKKVMNLGGFNNFEDAVKARKDAEEKYYGEYSYDNSQKITADYV